MPPDLPNEQELNLKKRARRRLVGAIALVLLMVIILPRILQDRAALAPQETIKITMPEADSSRQIDTAVSVVDPGMENSQVPQVDSTATGESIKSDNPVNSEVLSEIKAEVKTADIKDVKVGEPKAVETQSPQKNDGSFTIQVGVYSDIANVKQLQIKLNETGYKSRTEKITTPKGEKIRLKAGDFASRQEAVSALTKLQEAGLPGMVVSNE